MLSGSHWSVMGCREGLVDFAKKHHGGEAELCLPGGKHRPKLRKATASSSWLHRAAFVWPPEVGGGRLWRGP